MSQEGPQHGDPLGPLLFCNTIRPLLTSLGSDLRLGYMDDVTLGGSQDAVARDVQTVIEVGGLDLNISKCELISRPGCVVSDPTLQSFLQLPVSDAELCVLHCFLVLFLTQRGHNVVVTLPEQSTG